LCEHSTGFERDDAVEKNFLAPMHCGGAGFAIPFTLLKELAVWMETRPWPFVRGETISDRGISWALFRDLGISFSHEQAFGSQPPAFYLRHDWGIRDKRDGFGAAVSFHYVRGIAEMAELYKLLSIGFGTEEMFSNSGRFYPTKEALIMKKQSEKGFGSVVLEASTNEPESQPTPRRASVSTILGSE